MVGRVERLFFGYSGKPEILRETMHAVANRLSVVDAVESSVSWEDLRIDGRLIVNEVEKEIDKSTISLFEVSTLNDNVLFELGLAIGRGKSVGILLDSQDQDAARKWRDFGLLSSVGYTGYKNPDELFARVSAMVADPPNPLWDELAHGMATAVEDGRLVYFPSLKQDEASRRLSRVVERYEGFDTTTLDLQEYGGAPLAVFAQEVYAARVAVFHKTPVRAYLAELANPRLSFLAGLARGLGRDILIIQEVGDELALDYRDLSTNYSNAAGLEKSFRNWMDNLRRPSRNLAPRVRRHLSAELAALRFGSHVAESDQEGLERYFVETRDYLDVVEANATIFTGRKGTGKTANMLQAAQQLRADARNLVCVIKPASYELEGLVVVLRKFPSRHLSDYLIESLWRYLLTAEMGASAVRDAESRPAGIPSGSELDKLRTVLDERHGGVSASFSERLERQVQSLEQIFTDGIDQASIGESRQKISAALHGGALKELRTLIGAALSSRQRVAILVDNLDKAWERGADLELLSRLLLNLLSSVGKVVEEFNREGRDRQRVNVTLTVFLRSDIFGFIRDRAREPDKINVAEIEWRDPDLLARVLEDRFLAARDERSKADDLWSMYFAPSVRGVSSREYILARVQARPRDLVFFANAAVIRATNAKHGQIDESDILEAEKVYSQFAYEALLVEGVAGSVRLEEVLIEFAGERAILEREDLFSLLQSCTEPGVSSTDDLVRLLRRHGFLGLEVSNAVFDYGGTESEMKRADVRARKLEKSEKRQARYEIHPAYRAYLEVVE
jgi:hypothetical protein